MPLSRKPGSPLNRVWSQGIGLLKSLATGSITINYSGQISIKIEHSNSCDSYDDSSCHGSKEINEQQSGNKKLNIPTNTCNKSQQDLSDILQVILGTLLLLIFERELAGLPTSVFILILISLFIFILSIYSTS